MEFTFRIDAISDAAEKIVLKARTAAVICFSGESGAGKTTLIREICKQLQVVSHVNSPTFTIINEYRTNVDDTVFHIDLYRMRNEAEAIAAGVEDCLLSGNLCLVEWPEIAPGIIPDDAVHAELLAIDEQTRKLLIKS